VLSSIRMQFDVHFHTRQIFRLVTHAPPSETKPIPRSDATVAYIAIFNTKSERVHRLSMPSHTAIACEIGLAYKGKGRSVGIDKKLWADAALVYPNGVCGVEVDFI